MLDSGRDLNCVDTPRGARGAGWVGGDISPRLPKNLAAILLILGEAGAGDCRAAVGRFLLSCLLDKRKKVPEKILASDGQVCFKWIIRTLADLEQRLIVQINH